MSTPYTPGTGSKIITPGTGSDGSLAGSDLSRSLPRQISTGSTRGTQTVGYGATKIDGTNNTISIGSSILLDGNNEVIQVTSDDGSIVGLGKIPDNSGQFGFFSLDTNGNLIMKIVNGTKYVYDPANGFVNVTQDGLLPNGIGGFVAAKPGIDVNAAFS